MLVLARHTINTSIWSSMANETFPSSKENFQIEWRTRTAAVATTTAASRRRIPPVKKHSTHIDSSCPVRFFSLSAPSLSLFLDLDDDDDDDNGNKHNESRRHGSQIRFSSSSVCQSARGLLNFSWCISRKAGENDAANVTSISSWSPW